MRLAKQAWPSTFHLVVLMSIFSFLGLLTIANAHEGLPPPQRKREYTAAFRGVDSMAESMFSMANVAVVKHIHPVYEAREFLVEHNIVRKQFGEPPLVWDRVLAHYARRFAAQRAVNCDMIHTTDSPYGENIYWGANYFRHTASAAVRAWAGEIHDYNPLTNSCNPSKLCGHYKQIVWRTSSKVGCARVKCNNGGVYIICAYDPPGNYENESPFDIPVSVQGPPQSSQTPTTPAAQTPPTPAAPQTKTPASLQTLTTPTAKTTPTPASQTKTPASVQTLTTPTAQTTPTPVAQTKTPTSAHTTSPAAQTNTPTTAAQTKTPTSAYQTLTTPAAQTKTPTPAAQTKTPTSAHQTLTTPAAQTKTPTPAAQTKTPTSAHQTLTTPAAQTKTPTPAAQTKTPTSFHLTFKTPAAQITLTSPSTPS